MSEEIKVKKEDVLKAYNILMKAGMEQSAEGIRIMLPQAFEEKKKGDYDKDFGDQKICECGHFYYRHFDSYENNIPVGCKYCVCFTFKEKKKSELEFILEKAQIMPMLDIKKLVIDLAKKKIDEMNYHNFTIYSVKQKLDEM